MLSSLLKATVALALTPVALVIDVVRLPCDAYERGDAFCQTSTLLKAAQSNIKKAIK